MQTRNYYYLIAGLPDIVLEDRKLSRALPEVTEEFRTHIHPADLELLNLLILPRDNYNLLHLLLKKDADWQVPAVYSREQLEAHQREPEGLPVYMQDFIEYFKSRPETASPVQLENRLTAMYFEHALGTDNNFLRQWFDMERSRRNLLAAFNARTYKLPLDDQLIGDDDTTRAIRQSKLRDFGLGNDLPWLDRLLQISEQSNPLEQEKAIDLLRWRFIEECNIFNYFTIEAVLGYWLKMEMVSRWLRLDAAAGAEFFRQLLSDLEGSYTFPKTFAI